MERRECVRVQCSRDTIVKIKIIMLFNNVQCFGSNTLPPLTGKVNSGYKQLTVTHRSKMNTRNQTSDSSSAIHPLLNLSALLAAALFGRFCFRLDEGSVSGSGNNAGPCEVGVDLDASEDSGSP